MNIIASAAHIKMCRFCGQHARVITGKGELGAFSVSRRGLHASLETLVLLGKISADEAPEVARQIDETPLPFADWYAQRLPHVVADRRDLTGDHDEQYRHWDQILVDLAWPDDPPTLVCGEVPAGSTSLPGLCMD